MKTSLLLGLSLFTISAWAQADTEIYYVAFLRPDPARTILVREEGERIQTAHMANMRKMADDGYLVAAGPFDDTPSTISGVFILKAASLAEARKIANQDPTVTAKRNTIDVHVWKGPAGIGDEYQRLHKADPKTPDDMGLHPVSFLRPGPNWGKASTASLMADGPVSGKEVVDETIGELRKSGKLVAAGQIEGEDDFKAIVIFHRISLKEATRAMNDATNVSGGALKAEFHQFYSAAHVFTWNQ